ncbi:MAG TPA: HAD-IIIC family phosphatase [Kofleriaceae bacterium]|jgi:FkbH-like protein|nr:HAD-IIIC family phosphatase [Kofleriaceae bacterium]
MSSSILPAWLPVLADADAAFGALKAAADPAERFRQIARIAEHQLDFMQAGKLDRQLERTLAELPEPAGYDALRVAWLGSSTLDHLVPSARIASLRRGLVMRSYVAPYGQYRQELFDPASELATFRPHVVLLCLDPEHAAIDASLGAGLGATRGDVEAAVQARVAELRRLWLRASELGCAVIQQTLPNLAPVVFGSYDRALPGSPAAVLDRLNRAVIDAAVEDRVLLLDLAGWSARLGHDAWFDRVRWLQAKQLVAPTMAPWFGELVARLVAALRGRSRKCLVLDLDNTLWGGVVGDDGVERLVLGHGSAAGEGFTAFQQYARRLKDAGIVLAVCSKNDRAIAESAFTQHPEMVLRLDDFGVFVANWNDKAGNLRKIAEALNIGLDALVFFDDNPAERALVRAELPMVAVPEVPADPAYYVRTLEDAGYFEVVSLTGDDLARARTYQDNGRRAEALEAATDMDSFLAGLGMSLQIGGVDPHSIVRVTQLINKTNQFNVTTRRTTEAELRAFAAGPGNVAMHFRLLDRFGDNGLVGVLLARRAGDQLVIDTLLMSCRVLGRGVELAMINELVARAAAAGVAEILGEYIPTAKNGMVADLFGRLGFTRIEPTDRAETKTPEANQPRAGSRWRLDVRAFTRHPNFIAVGDP